MQGPPSTIKRRLTVDVEFHQVDMIRVVHNAVYFLWFEKGRLDVIEQFFPLAVALEKRMALPVVENHCEYRWPAVLGDTLVVTTTHRKTDHWSGRFLFEHTITHLRTKREICTGRSAVTVVDLDTRRPVKHLPEEIWECYSCRC